MASFNGTVLRRTKVLAAKIFATLNQPEESRQKAMVAHRRLSLPPGPDFDSRHPVSLKSWKAAEQSAAFFF